jgi:phage gpG-like protein
MRNTGVRPGGGDIVIRIRIKGVAQVSMTLQNLLGYISDLRPMFERIGKEIIFPSLLANFAAGGRPRPWRPLSARYASYKVKKYGPTPVLIARGALVNAVGALGADESLPMLATERRLHIQVVGDTAARTGLFYGIFHSSRRPRKPRKDGSAKLPRRQWFMLQADDAQAIYRFAQQYIIAGMTRSQRMKFSGPNR